MGGVKYFKRGWSQSNLKEDKEGADPIQDFSIFKPAKKITKNLSLFSPISIYTRLINYHRNKLSNSTIKLSPKTKLIGAVSISMELACNRQLEIRKYSFSLESM